jgi:predicted house-cleaning noncanonical NTP pyrophosphatase (MazG superfamily)
MSIKELKELIKQCIHESIDEYCEKNVEEYDDQIRASNRIPSNMSFIKEKIKAHRQLNQEN